ncbi:phage antirepressor KilAC domain-containing protein [Eggerthellaceae bacterium 24-137]
MTQNIETFNHEQFGSLRAVTNGHEPMFVAADACKSLDIKNPTDAIARLDDDEKARLNLGLPGGDTNVITFPGLLNLVLGSRKPEAKAYKRWVTHEVLPSIHRTGGYMVAGNDETPEETMARALLIAKEAMERKDARIAALEEKGKRDAVIIDAQGDTIGKMLPKALFADAVATSKSSILVGELAKILKQNGVKNMGQNRLFDWLRNKGYLMKQGSSYNMPTQRSMDLGLFEIKETSITHSDGHVTVSKTHKVTGRGQQYFVNKFLAMVEK